MSDSSTNRLLLRYPSILKRIFLVGAIYVSFSGRPMASFAEERLAADHNTLKVPFFAADYEKKIAGLIGSDNKFLWQIKVGNIHDVQSLKNGGWLLQTDFSNVVEVDKDGAEVWKYESPLATSQPVEIHSFERFEDGTTMIAESGPARIIEVDKDKKVLRTINLKVDHPHPHRDTRLVRRTSSGTYLVAHEGDECIREYDMSGKVVWEHPVQHKVYSAVRLSSGNTLVGTGDGHSVIEVTPDHKVVWEFANGEIQDVKLGWITMVDRLPNGNTWIVNCHAGEGQPQILEVTKDKKLAASFLDFDRFGNALPVAVLK